MLEFFEDEFWKGIVFIFGGFGFGFFLIVIGVLEFVFGLIGIGLFELVRFFVGLRVLVFFIWGISDLRENFNGMFIVDLGLFEVVRFFDDFGVVFGEGGNNCFEE